MSAWAKRLIIYGIGAVIWGFASAWYVETHGRSLPRWVLILGLLIVVFIAERVASPKRRVGISKNVEFEEFQGAVDRASPEGPAESTQPEITVGMTAEKVQELLGQPTMRMSGEEFLQRFGKVVVMGSGGLLSHIAGSEFWLYQLPSIEFRIVITNGRVSKTDKIEKYSSSEQKHPDASPNVDKTKGSSGLQKPTEHEQKKAEFKSQLRKMLMRHVKRIRHAYGGKQGFIVTLCLMEKLLDQERLDYTVNTISRQLFETIYQRRHVFSSKSFEDLFLVVSTLPAYEIERAREFFAPAGYLRFLEKQGLHLAAQSGQCAAHWIFCVEPEGNRGMAHLTFFPDISQAPQGQLAIIFAQDMFTPSEKASLHLQ